MSLDREIEDLFAVEPSPEFVTRVRQRIAAEPEPRAWWFSWRLPAAAGAAAATFVVAVSLWPQFAPATQPVVVPTTEIAVAPATGAAAAPPTQVAIALASERAGVPASEPRAARANRITRPVVLIRRDEAEAMELLLQRVGDRTLPDMTEVLAVVDATGPKWIEIPPVVIEPIATGEGE